MSIFTCNLCTQDYNELNKRPLILPCGHVYCEKCISQMKVTDATAGFKCFSDNIVHKIELQRIPICAQILLNLPKQPKQSDFIHCSRHQTKKIKFHCRTHNVFPCSICITEHTDHDIVCFEAKKTAFANEVKQLIKQIDTEKTVFYQRKLKHDQYEKSILQHQETQMVIVNNHFNSLMGLIKERKRLLISELSKYIEDKRKGIEYLNKKQAKTSDVFMELGRKGKYIEELYNKGEYEVFANYRMKILNEIKALNSSYNDNNSGCGNSNSNSSNRECLIEFCVGHVNKLSDVIGEFKLKSNKGGNYTRSPNSHIKANEGNSNNSNCNNGNSNIRNMEISVEETKSIDTIATFMLHNNDANNIFKQNLLTVNDKDKDNDIINANDNDNDTHKTTEVNTQHHHIYHPNKNKDKDTRTEYQHFVALAKPEGPISLPTSNANTNKSQSNREHNTITNTNPNTNNNSHYNNNSNNNNQIYVQRPFQQKTNTNSNNTNSNNNNENSNRKNNINSHFNANIYKHNQNQVLPQQIYQSKNSNPVSINTYMQNEVINNMKNNFQSNERVVSGRILNTEASYDKARKKSNDYVECKYSPLFSSPNEIKDSFFDRDRDNINKKMELNKKRYVNSIKSNTNSNNSNSSSNKNLKTPKIGYNRSCNKSKKKKKKTSTEHSPNPLYPSSK